MPKLRKISRFFTWDLMEGFVQTYNNDRTDFSNKLDRCLNLVPRVDSVEGHVNRLEKMYRDNKSINIKITGIPSTVTDNPEKIEIKVLTNNCLKLA